MFQKLSDINTYKAFFLSKGESHDFTRTIKKNIAGALVIKGLNILINLLYVPLLIHYLDIERYGVWIALTSFLAWFQFFDIGIGNGLRNSLTKAIVAKNYEKAKGLISTSYLVVFAIFISLLILFSVLTFFIDWSGFLNTSLIGNRELQLLALIVFSGLCLRFIVQLIQPVLYSVQKSALSSAFPTIANLISLITIYVLSKTESNPLLMAGITISIAPVLTFLVGTVLLFNSNLNYLKPSLRYVNRSFGKEITSIGMKFLFIQIAAVLLNSSASLILIKLFGANEVTVYNIAYKYFQVALILNVIIVTPLWSGFAELLAKRDYEWIRKAFRKINRISVFLSLLIIVMTIISPWTFRWWIGDSIAVPMAVTITMAVYSIQIVFISVYNMFINGSGKIKLSMYFTIFEIVAYLSLAFILSRYVMGPIGVIVASIITKTFTFILQYVQVNKILNEKAYGIWNE